MKIIITYYIWAQSSWEGGANQFYFYDTTKYLNIENLDPYKPRGSLSLSYKGFLQIFQLDTSSLSRVTKIKEIDNVYYFLKSYPTAKIFFSLDLVNLQSFPDFPYPQYFLVESVHDILKKGNFFIVCGKKYWAEVGFIYKFDRNQNSWLWPPLQIGGVQNIYGFIDNFPPTYITAFSKGTYQLIKSNDLFSTFSTFQISPGLAAEKIVLAPDNSIQDTLLVGIFFLSGLRNIYYSDYNPPEGSWYNYYPTWKSFEAGEITYRPNPDYVYIPISKAESSLIRLFNVRTKTIDTTIYIDNSASFKGLTLGVDKNLYAATINKIYRSHDGKKFEVLGSVPKAFTILQTSDYELLIGTTNPAKIFKSFYSDSGVIESSIFISRDKKEGKTLFKRIYIEGENINYVKIQIRGDTLDSLKSASPWDHIPYLQSGDTITHLNPKFIYFQYRIKMYKTENNKTPIVDKIYFVYDLDTTGPYILSSYISDGNFSQDGVDFDDRLVIVFSEETNTPRISLSGIDTLFYISGGKTLVGSDSIRWKSSDTLEVFIYNSLAPPQNGDTIKILKRFISDEWGNKRLSFAVINGSYDDFVPPKLKKVLLSDGTFHSDGVENGDSVIMIFSEKTNTPYIPPESLDFWFPLKNRSWLGEGYSLETTWKSQEVFVVLFSGEGREPILKDDSISVSNRNKIEDLAGNRIMPQKIKTEGSLDKQRPKIYSSIFYDFIPYSTNPNSNFDHTLIRFTEPIYLLGDVNSSNINSVFKLSFNHSWLSGNGEILRSELLNDTIFLIQFSTSGGNPTVSEGDTITPDTLFFVDRNKNRITGKSILERYQKLNESLKEPNFVFSAIGNNLVIISRYDFKLKLYDLGGRKVLEKNYKSGLNKLSFNFTPGQYFLSIERNNKEILKKKIFLIEKNLLIDER
ncbi:MAG: hypothetical protein ABDH49_05955 [Candidatus Hydrothermales bacterium]